MKKIEGDKAIAQRTFLPGWITTLIAGTLLLQLACSGPGLFPFSIEQMPKEFEKLVNWKTSIDEALEQGCRKRLSESGINVDRYRAKLEDYMERGVHEGAKYIYRKTRREVSEYHYKARDAGCPPVAVP